MALNKKKNFYTVQLYTDKFWTAVQYDSNKLYCILVNTVLEISVLVLKWTTLRKMPNKAL